MNTKLAFLSVFILLNMNINFCFAQNNTDSTYTQNADSTINIAKKKSLFKKNKEHSKKETKKYQLSEEEIRLRNAHPDSLSKREKKKLEKSYKKERKYNSKNGLKGDIDPITQSLMMKNQEYEGMNLNENDIRTLSRINKKYGITQEDLKLRESNQDTLNILQRFKIARTYRKEYLRKRKLQKFWKNKIYSMQPPDAKKRMKEHEKRIKQRDRHRKWVMRKKRFLNMFK
jgi:hypothetical protein